MKVNSESGPFSAVSISRLNTEAISIDVNNRVRVYDEDRPSKARVLELTEEQARALRRQILSTFCELDPAHFTNGIYGKGSSGPWIWPEVAAELEKASASWKDMLTVDDHYQLTHEQQAQWQDEENTVFTFPKGFGDLVINLGGFRGSYPSSCVHSQSRSQPQPGWETSPVVSTQHEESLNWAGGPVIRTIRPRAAELSRKLSSCTGQELSLSAEQLAEAKPVFEKALEEILSDDKNRLSFLYDTEFNKDLTEALTRVGTQFIKDQGYTCESQSLLENVSDPGDNVSLDLAEVVTRILDKNTFREQPDYRLSHKLEKLKGKPEDAFSLKSAAGTAFEWFHNDFLPEVTKGPDGKDVRFGELSDMLTDVVKVLSSAGSMQRLGKDTAVSIALLEVADPASEAARHYVWHEGSAADVGTILDLEADDIDYSTHLAITMATHRDEEEDDVWTVGLNLNRYAE